MAPAERAAGTVAGKALAFIAALWRLARDGNAMQIQQDSVHFHILEALCALPEAVRGITSVMLNRKFDAPRVLAELESDGLIAEKGWDKGPGAVLVATEAGVRLYHELAVG